MKFLFVLAVVVGVIWLWGGAARRRDAAARQAKASVAEPLDMVQCAHCGLHLARAEALLGSGQAFCNEAHRVAHERGHG